MTDSESRKRRFLMLIKKYRTSEMTITDFCIKHNIHKWSFWYWRKKALNEQPAITTLSTRKSKNTPTFLPVTIRHTPIEKPEEKIEIHYPSGVHISLPTSYELANLRLLISEPGNK